MSDIKKITLPISKKEVEIRPLKTKDIRKADKECREASNIERAIYLTSAITSLSTDDIDELDFRDYLAIQTEVEFFLEK